MDQAKYLMLARRRLSDQKPIFTTPHVAVGSSAPYYESWEERAFAEDSVGHLGGCIWPPRSYTCTFCSREFRSAQALGGHMNVHRRDRARLKLAAAAADDSASDPRQNYMIHPCHSEDGPPHRGYSQNHSAANANPNPNSICSVLAYPSRSLSHAAAKSCWGEHIMNSSLNPPLAGNDHGKKEVFIGPVQLAEEHSKTAARVCSNTELHVGSGELELYTVLGCRTWRDFEGDDDYDDEEIVGSSSKRRRIDLSSSPLILNSSAGKYQQQHGGKDDLGKVLKLYPSSPVEELDLELRLGEAPKVK